MDNNEHCEDRTMNWRSMKEAPTDGSEIIGLGFPPFPSKNAHHFGPDVRKIRAWRIDDHMGWNARNNFDAYTVGFHPIAWMPNPQEPSQ